MSDTDESEFYEPSFWAILGGAVLGVGAVAAAPFTGGGSVLAATTLAGSLAGAGTVAAAVGAGATGAIVGAELSSGEKGHQKGHRKGKRTAKAEYDIRLKKLAPEMKSYVDSIREKEEYFKAILAMFAVGISVANCDGEIHKEERKTIDLYIFREAASRLPKSVKKKLERMYQAPPNLQTAFKLAQKANVPMSLCDGIIDVVIDADGVEKADERAFLAGWRRLRLAAS